MTSFMASGHLKLNKKSLSKTKSMFGEPLKKNLYKVGHGWGIYWAFLALIQHLLLKSCKIFDTDQNNRI